MRTNSLGASENIDQLQERLGYRFKNPELLQQALKHRSAGAKHNERLEFRGDAVLELAVTDLLYRQFETSDEGRLTRFRARLVRKETLAERARALVLGRFLVLGSGERKSGGSDRDSILADAFEAILGAIYLDADFLVAKERIECWFEQSIEGLDTLPQEKDPKTRLQEHLQGLGEPVPEYRVVSVSGDDHQQRFKVECRCSLIASSQMAEGDSIKQAEQKAATACLDRLISEKAGA